MTNHYPETTNPENRAAGNAPHFIPDRYSNNPVEHFPGTFDPYLPARQGAFQVISSTLTVAASHAHISQFCADAHHADHGLTSAPIGGYARLTWTAVT